MLIGWIFAFNYIKKNITKGALASQPTSLVQELTIAIALVLVPTLFLILELLTNGEPFYMAIQLGFAVGLLLSIVSILSKAFSYWHRH